jgi:molecular chaperone GrpE (heat shock protein)
MKTMTESDYPRMPKWPFFLGDLLLLGAAYAIIHFGSAPLDFGRLCLLVGAVALGAGFSVYPFIHDFKVATKLAEATALTSVTAQMGNLENLAAQIQNATSRWQLVQETADKTAAKADEIAQRMTSEAKAFASFMQNANDSEKSTLRLEVDKLRRAEGEWLQASVHILDHIYALNQGAIRSGQPKLIENLSHFQNACREIFRRLGLLAYGAKTSEPFDPHKHELPEGDSSKAAGLAITENLACGYTFQGKLLRPAIVRVQSGETTQPTEPVPAEPGNESPS